jgi:hypothetical protein
MKRVLPFLGTVGIVALLFGPATGQAAAASAKTQSSRSSPAEVVSGGATQSDLHLNWLRDFSRFEDAHPAIAREFRQDPLLVRNAEFRSEHSSWAAFLKEHPAIRSDIEANPGNYLVIPPRLAYGAEHGWQSAHTHANGTKAKA